MASIILNMARFKEYGLAFGEAVISFQTPPSRSPIRDGVTRYRPTESGFGGWAVPRTPNGDEKTKTVREAGPLSSREKIQPTASDNISDGAISKPSNIRDCHGL